MHRGLLVAGVVLTGCSLLGVTPTPPPADPGAPVIRITSEGGLAPRAIPGGPVYQVLGDNRLLFAGAVPAIFPGPLVAPYQQIVLTESEMGRVRGLIEAIGLPRMTMEYDDTLTDRLADGTTETIVYFDADGIEHVYSVYGLGQDPDPERAETTAFLELYELLGRLAFSRASTEFNATSIEVIALPAEGEPEPGFEDVRPWPLPDHPLPWDRVETTGWECRILGGQYLAPFLEATQLTRWQTPDGAEHTLYVRQLLPGEPGCGAG